MKEEEKKALNAFQDNGGEEAVDMSRQLKIGIIGTGWIAGAHMESYLHMPDAQVVAGADLVPGKQTRFLRNSE